MRRLSGLDAGFLSLETPTTPMTIGSLSILDPATDSGRLDVDRLRAFLRSRLESAPVLCRRLSRVPFDLWRPYWTEVAPADVDLEYHVEKTELPKPRGWREISQLVAWELSRPLERERPLWQLLFVEGLDSVPEVAVGAVAIISRVHHAAVDGVSGAEILGALSDAGGRPPVRARVAPGGVRVNAREGGVVEVIRRLGRDVAGAPAEVSRTIGRSLLGFGGGALHLAKQEIGRQVTSTASTRASSISFMAPRTRLNRPVTARRSWAPALFRLDLIKAIKAARDATVNDVVLAICAGALREWLKARDDLPQEPLVAMVPVSVRSDTQRSTGGNLVSAMLISLATDEPDPLQRLSKIRAAARSSKVTHQAVGARTLVDAAQLVPFALSGLGVRLYSRLHMAERHRPLFNLVITNVPGPPVSLSVAGASMLFHVAAAPVFDGLGLILPIFSYAGTLSVGVTADHDVMPDATEFADRLTMAFEELESSALSGGDGE